MAYTTPKDTDQGVVINAEKTIFDSSDRTNCTGPCTEIGIGCPPASSNSLLVWVEGLHKIGQYAEIGVGGFIYFRLKPCGIGKVKVKPSSGTSIVDWLVTERSYNV